MGARPIALLNSLRFGPLETDHETDTDAAARNRYLFGGVVGGIAGYGNCIGIPDVGGEVTFDPSYSGNPIVNAMCVGIARHDEITLARAAGAGNVLLLVGASTGRDGIQGASFASATIGEDREERRPAVQVGNPFLEKLLMEACLELARLDGVVAMQDLGAAGLTCALAELTARGGVGARVDLDAVPRREGGMTPYEVLLSESQERMLVVVRPVAVPEVRAIFDRYELAAAEIGTITDEPLIRCHAGGEPVCEVAGRSLADDAPRYVIAGTPVEPPPADLEALAREMPDASVLLELLASPNLRDRKPIWRRYDHMNGTNTLVGPGAGDAALLRLKGTSRALALAIDGPGPARLGALDPYLAGASAVIEGALNVACAGALPIGITDCLNFGSPETDLGAWQLEHAIDGIAAACRLLDLPVVSGNVSLYNETPDGPILPTPVVGTVGLLDDRDAAVPMAWQAGDEIWLIGDLADDPEALAGSELAWARGARGGRPRLDLEAAARVVRLLPVLATRRAVAAAHDVSVGGLGVALARMAIASGLGARVELASARPTAALFGERSGRVIVTVQPGIGLEVALAEAQVPGRRLGSVAGSSLEMAAGDARLTVEVDALGRAWRRPF
jgi:phosphoribosylformylglycinamidine synthase